MDWQTRRDQAVGFVVIAFGATIGVLLCLAMIVGIAVGLSRISEVTR